MISTHSNMKQNTSVVVGNLDASTATLASNIFVDKFVGVLFSVFEDELTYKYDTESQKDNVQIESDAEVLDSDLITGERISIVKVMSIDDLKVKSR